MSERHLKLLLEDMLESSRLIIQYTSGMDFDTFLSDRKTRDAVVRNIEVIGEAGNAIPEEFRSELRKYLGKGYGGCGIASYMSTSASTLKLSGTS